MRQVLITIALGVLMSCSPQKKADPEADRIAEERAKHIVDSIKLAAKEGRTSIQQLYKNILLKEGVKQVGLTDTDILAIAVTNNGENFKPMAKYYLRLANDYGVAIKGVKILDAKDAIFEKGSAYGTILAREFNEK